MIMSERKIAIRFDVDMKQEFEMILDAASFLEDLGIRANIPIIVGKDMTGRTPFYKMISKGVKGRDVPQHSNFGILPKSYFLETLVSPLSIDIFKDQIRQLTKFKHEILCHGLDHPKWSYGVMNDEQKAEWFQDSQNQFKKLAGSEAMGFAPPCFVFKDSDADIASKHFKYVSTISRDKKIIFYKNGLVDVPVTIAGPDSFTIGSVKGGAVPLLDYLLSRNLSERSIVEHFKRLPLNTLDTYYFHLVYEFKYHRELLHKILLILTERRASKTFSEIIKGGKHEGTGHGRSL
jgi:hypothetical protein